MDLQYLLLLQQLRESAGELMTSFMMLVTNFAMFGSAVLCVIIFWTVDKVLGYWLISNTVSGIFLNNVIKLTACVYRPWIRWPQLDPPERAIESATGYSFPSGHTQVASSFFGTCSLSMWKKNRAVSVLCIAIIFLTAFSRNYLGVHTLTDVLTSLLISVILIAVSARLFEAVQKDSSLLVKLIAAGCVAAVLAIIYFTFKTYPMDYIDGDLIVDPAFTTEGTLPVKILRVVCGLPFILLLMLILKKPVYSLIGTSAGHVALYTVLALYIVAGYPALFTAVSKYRNSRQNEKTD